MVWDSFGQAVTEELVPGRSIAAAQGDTAFGIITEQEQAGGGAKQQGGAATTSTGEVQVALHHEIVKPGRRGDLVELPAERLGRG